METRRASVNRWRYLVVIIPIVIIIGIIWIPNLFTHFPLPEPLDFHVTQQIETEDGITLYGNMNERIVQGEHVWLYAENAKIQVLVHDTTMTFNEYGDTPSMFQSPGSGWFSFTSDTIEKQDTIEITVSSYYGENEVAIENLLDKLCMGDGATLFHELGEQFDFFGIIILIMFFCRTPLFYRRSSLSGNGNEERRK